MKILIVDDHITTLKTVSLILKSGGFKNIVETIESREVLNLIEKDKPDLILLDIEMPYLSGDKLLVEIKSKYPDISVIMLTGVNDVEMIVQLMKAGASDYLLKPPDRNRILEVVKKIEKIKSLEARIDKLKDAVLDSNIKNNEAFSEIKTISKNMLSIFRYLEAIRYSLEPVLITGETGVGKELFAKAVHKLSDRKGEFVPINIAGLSDELFSDTLFGHKKGAFTNAVTDRVGLIERANGGTLFMDEIGDLEPISQIKLLRLLQEGSYYPLGADKPIKSDIKIVMATNKNLEKMVEDNSFRKDLYYRLYTHRVTIPPLKERKIDINILVNHFIKEAATKLGKKELIAPNELFTLLNNYDFPGNIRELRALVFDAVTQTKSKSILSKKIIEDRIFIKYDKPSIKNVKNNQKVIFTENLPMLKEMEHIVILEAMKRADNNQTIAAKLLGITRQALNQRLKKM